MSRNCSIAVAAISSIFATAAPALAECDPAKFLKYEEIKYSKDIATQFFYLDTLSKAERDKVDTGGGFVYDGIPMNGHATVDVASSLSKQLRIDFSNSEKTWYTISKLSSTGKDAYLGCLRDSRDNFYLAIVGDAMKTDEFFVQINSTPRQPLPLRQPISVEVTHGEHIGGDKFITSTKSAQLKIRRDLSQETIISVKVGDGDYQSIDLPPVPASIAVHRRESTHQDGDVYGGSSDLSHDLCINLPNEEQDAAIIPDSFATHFNYVENNMGSILFDYAGHHPSVTSRSACAKVWWHLSSQQGRVHGTAWISVQVAKVVPPKVAPYSPSQQKSVGSKSSSKRRVSNP
ncbi:MULTISPECIES: hypothetical protein [unclassified Bradyrhizobium]|uniref:hypothetical protein n=1 Tax=Bradyrhizobium sp. USDA 4541 TaxID=2817704 RepID=UPI0020A33837|nr:hypothetical protein [Bradyrhizobium sp. USDA 4541]MCP1851220.1 hypothetical protein [Bradyrhizobium sp. USDA 4541]